MTQDGRRADVPPSWFPCWGRSRCRWLRRGWRPPSPRRYSNKKKQNTGLERFTLFDQPVLWSDETATMWTGSTQTGTCRPGCSCWPVSEPAGPSDWSWSESSSRSSSTSPGWRWICPVTGGNTARLNPSTEPVPEAGVWCRYHLLDAVEALPVEAEGLLEQNLVLHRPLVWERREVGKVGQRLLDVVFVPEEHPESLEQDRHRRRQCQRETFCSSAGI